MSIEPPNLLVPNEDLIDDSTNNRINNISNAECSSKSSSLYVKNDTIVNHSSPLLQIEKLPDCFFEPFLDDGTLNLLHIACLHPTLMTCLERLTQKYILEHDHLLKECFSQTSFLFADLNRPCIGTLHLLRDRCRILTEDLTRDTLSLDCIDLDVLKPEWGTKASVRQARKEFIQLSEGLNNKIDQLLSFLTTILSHLAEPSIESLIPSDNVYNSGTHMNQTTGNPANVLSSLTSVNFNSPLCNSSSNKNVVDPSMVTTRSDNSLESKKVLSINQLLPNPLTHQHLPHTKKTSRFDIPPSHVVNPQLNRRPIGLYDYSSHPVPAKRHCNDISLKNEHTENTETSNVCITKGRGSHIPKQSYRLHNRVPPYETNSQWIRKPDDNNDSHEDATDSDSGKRHKRHKGRRSPVNWDIKVREKIDFFKEHTSQGGCVTTLYDNPVNRETLLTLLSKCEPYLQQQPPVSHQIKISIETFIAGLESAYNYLQQLRVNKTQMRLLYQSATVLDTLSDPIELLPELKSLQGLLKTFGMF